MTPKLLYITNQDPNGIGGGCYASHAYLKAFSSIFSGNIDLCISDTCKEQDPQIKINKIYRVPQRNIFRKLLSPFTGELHRFTHCVKNLIKKNDYNYCVFDHNKLAGTLIKDITHRGIKVITIHHNYEPEYFLDNTRNLVIRKLILHHVIQSEKMAYIHSHYNLFLTQSDQEKFRQVYGPCMGQSSILGVFEYEHYDTQISKPNNNKTLTIAITGSMDNEQGVDGIKYFLNDLYPYAPSNSKIVIAGKNPTDEIKKLCALFHNVTLIPNPPSMDDIINNSHLYICPTRLGGGLKLRIMDGLKKGLPVITHSCSSRGYDYFWDSSFFKIFSSPEQFSQSINEISTLIKHDGDYRYKIIEDYQKIFSYEAGVKRLHKILNQEIS